MLHNTSRGENENIWDLGHKFLDTNEKNYPWKKKKLDSIKIRNFYSGYHQYHKSLLPATREAEQGEFQVQSQLGMLDSQNKRQKWMAI